MRKLSMFVLLATAAIPAMASAQDQGEHQSGRAERSEARAARADRPERAERAERIQQRNEAREQFQAQRQIQIERQVQPQQQVQIQQQVQAEQRFRRGREDGAQQGRDNRDEQMQLYRQRMEQRQALEGRPAVQDNGLVERQGRYRPVPNVNPLVGQPAPENRDGRYVRRDDHRDRPQWVNNWRDDRRYDWRNYRDRHRSTFRIGFYFDPFGYSYRRFGIGSYLYPSYYQSNYWIDDPWQYRLPPAYGPYRWVRYHNDALLIDTWSGEVVDVIYGFFW